MYELIKENGQYGIKNDEVYVKDIVQSSVEAYALAYMLNQYEVSLHHLYDIIEDFWELL